MDRLKCGRPSIHRIIFIPFESIIEKDIQQQRPSFLNLFFEFSLENEHNFMSKPFNILSHCSMTIAEIQIKFPPEIQKKKLVENQIKLKQLMDHKIDDP